MTMLWKKILPFYIVFLLCALYFCLFSKTAKATEIPFYDQETIAGAMGANDGTEEVGTIFTATHDNVTKWHFANVTYGTPWTMSTNGMVHICEVASLASAVCIGNYRADNWVYDDSVQNATNYYDWQINATSTYSTIIGHFYKIWITKADWWGGFAYNIYDTIANATAYQVYSGGFYDYSNAREGYGILYYDMVATTSTLTINYQDLNNATGMLFLSGECKQVGTGIHQLNLYADAYPDPNSVWNGGLADCYNGIWAKSYNGRNLNGTHTLFIDDTLFGTEIATTSQNFGTSTTADWVFTVGYTGTSTEHGGQSGEINTHDLACSADAWNSTTEYLGINFQVTICNTFQWLLDVGIKPQQYIANKLGNLRDSIMNMFPFDLLKTINDSFTNSTNGLTSFIKPKMVYADSFSTSTGIYTGSGDGFSFSIPNFLGTAGTSTFTIFKKADIVGFMGEDVFNIYYYFCRFLIWALFLTFCWHLITERSHNELL